MEIKDLIKKLKEIKETGNFSMKEKEELYEEFQSLLAKGSMLPAELVSLAIEVFTIGE